MVSPVKPTHFCTERPDRCSTTTYAWCEALAFTHAGVGLPDADGVELLQAAAARTMASIALAGEMCFRTGRTSRRSPTERAAESRPPGASVPLRADGCLRFGIQVSWLADPHLRLPSRALTQWRYSGSGSSLTVARQLRHHTGFPWCPWRSYARSAVRRTQPSVLVAAIAKSKRSAVSASSRSVLGKPGQSPCANLW